MNGAVILSMIHTYLFVNRANNNLDVSENGVFYSRNEGGCFLSSLFSSVNSPSPVFSTHFFFLVLELKPVHSFHVRASFAMRWIFNNKCIVHSASTVPWLWCFPVASALKMEIGRALYPIHPFIHSKASQSPGAS